MHGKQTPQMLIPRAQIHVRVRIRPQCDVDGATSADPGMHSIGACDFSSRVVACDTGKKFAEIRHRYTKSSLEYPLRERNVVHADELINFALQNNSVTGLNVVAEKHVDQTMSEMLIRVG